MQVVTVCQVRISDLVIFDSRLKYELFCQMLCCASAVNKVVYDVMSWCITLLSCFIN
jgi:hypothetical protein